MQDQNLVGKHSSVKVLSQSLLNSASPAVCAVSLSENNVGADADCLNQSRNLDENVKLEITQPSLSGKNDAVRVYEESTPDASIMDSSSTWGDFEGFSEVKLDILHNTPESLQKVNEKQTYNTAHNDSNPTSYRQLFSNAAEYSGRENFATVSVKDVLSSKYIIEQSFPEIPVPLFLEKISTLEQVLYTEREDAEVPESAKNQLCADPKNLWKTLTQPRISSSLRRPWNESHYQANLLDVLGVDSHQKPLQESKDDSSEKTDFRENEDSSVDKFNISTCKALIQTKLSVSPRQSHLFSYNLFFKKTSPHGNMQYITVPQKKRIFTTQSLRMKMFNSNVC